MFIARYPRRTRLMASGGALVLLSFTLAAQPIICAAPASLGPDGQPGFNDNFSDRDAIVREIEEADIVKVVDGHLYLANPFKGLRIIDATDVTAPVLRGGATLGGRGVELFVRDDLAFVFTAADYFTCAGDAVGFEGGEFDELLNPDYEGSRLWVVDISDKDAPQVVSTFDFAGFISATRRVEDVIYVAGDIVDGAGGDDGDGGDNENDNGSDNGNDNETGDNDNDNGSDNGSDNDNGDGENGNDNDNDGGDSGNDNESGDVIDDEPLPAAGVFVTSINIADPQNITEVETIAFGGSALDIHVSSTALYVFGADPELDETTLVSYVDIRDPGGDIVRRDQFRVPGLVEDRFFVDEYQGVFRIVTEEFNYNTFRTVVALYTYDAIDPDAITRLADLTIVTDESLRAVRFDGPRGYAVTFVQIDPLFVLDLSNPAAPKVSGELEVPGWSTHLEPLGDRLIGVGFDDTNGFRPAIALYDVSDPSKPAQRDRIILGDRGRYDTTSEATVDEKALKIIEEAGLILLPFSTYDSDLGEYVDSLAMIQLTSSLRQRGSIDHRGLVRRSDLLDDHVWVLSDVAFQTVNIDDLDAPKSEATIDIAAEQELLDAGLSACVDSARFHGTEFDGFFNGGFWGDTFFDPCGLLTPLFLFSLIFGLVTLKTRRPPPNGDR